MLIACFGGKSVSSTGRILKADPGEWNDLSEKREAVADDLRSEILGAFDPEAIKDEVNRSIRRRALIHESMQASGTSWAHEPRFDPAKNVLDQYRPE